MALLERSRWYDMARSTNWTPTYVQEEDIFPPDMSDVFGLGMDVWDQYDEPYKVSFRDYVRAQREKDTATSRSLPVSATAQIRLGAFSGCSP